MKNKFFVSSCLALSFFSAFIPEAHAIRFSDYKAADRNPSFTLGLVYGYLDGHTTYHISSYSYSGLTGIESELEFPLKTTLAGIAAAITSHGFQTGDGFRLNIKWLKNIDDGSGKMKDSDWLTDDLDIVEVGSAHPGLDIYSESEIELDANIIDLNIFINTSDKEQFRFGPILGYKYEKFKYGVSNTYQVGYGPYHPSYTGYIPGDTLKYDVMYNMFYAGLNAEMISGGFRAKAMIGFSPWTTGEDRDDHLLRYKLSTADTTGTSFMGAVRAEWELSPQWSLEIGGEYMRIKTTGTQTQFFYAGPDAGLSFSIDDKITSEQLFISTMLTFRFPTR